MAITNGYITLAEFKAYVTAPGQTMAVSAADDSVLEQLIEQVSRYFDGETSRTFYPRVETRSLSVPDDEDQNDTQILYVDDDLLEITTLTNGDSSVIAAASYHLLPKNQSPRYGIQLRNTASISWQTTSAGDPDFAITCLGYWGYHNDYAQHAWATGSTLNEVGGLNATDTTFTVTSGTNFSAGQIVKCESELMIISSISTNDLTIIKRGDNGSTAATHVDTSTITIWIPIKEIKQAAYEVIQAARLRRFGQSQSGITRVTAAGIVIMPQDITEMAQRVIDRYRKLVWL